ncbi:uncharacterized protein C8Q71DRAFT_57541 [Rhodofomes roseus]|uniref:Uncharacterized protein n=1 Tax=Rhodofomes roseus TaxID=34475 RepID=A0ABQ8KGF2_9APHY|nr:uncharacterized protein C8Q71DRAFT_57541 [Rhodofomes roseus]KAH9836750.1 hypothetical protein C8Q71DRAFT_57541 [Rhodofomes roseus]
MELGIPSRTPSTSAERHGAATNAAPPCSVYPISCLAPRVRLRTKTHHCNPDLLTHLDRHRTRLYTYANALLILSLTHSSRCSRCEHGHASEMTSGYPHMQTQERRAADGPHDETRQLHVREHPLGTARGHASFVDRPVNICGAPTVTRQPCQRDDRDTRTHLRSRAIEAFAAGRRPQHASAATVGCFFEDGQTGNALAPRASWYCNTHRTPR